MSAIATDTGIFVNSYNHVIVHQFYDELENHQVQGVSQRLTNKAWLKQGLNNPETILPKGSLLQFTQMGYIDKRKSLASTRKIYTGVLDEEGRPKNLNDVLWFPSGPYPLFRAINSGNPEMVKVLLDAGADPNRITPYDLCYILLEGEFSLSKLSGKTISNENQRAILKLLIMNGYDPKLQQTYHYSTPNSPEATRSFYDILKGTKENHGLDPKEVAELVQFMDGCIVEYQASKNNPNAASTEESSLATAKSMEQLRILNTCMFPFSTAQPFIQLSGQAAPPNMLNMLGPQFHSLMHPFIPTVSSAATAQPLIRNLFTSPHRALVTDKPPAASPVLAFSTAAATASSGTTMPNNFPAALLTPQTASTTASAPAKK